MKAKVYAEVSSGFFWAAADSGYQLQYDRAGTESNSVEELRLKDGWVRRGLGDALTYPR